VLAASAEALKGPEHLRVHARLRAARVRAWAGLHQCENARAELRVLEDMAAPGRLERRPRCKRPVPGGDPRAGPRAA
jgi:hypothetical protein